MPRPKTHTAPKTNKTTTSKPTASAKKAVVKKRTRRSPNDLVQELKTKRESLAASFESRMAKLDQRIQTLESKHESKIKVSELLLNRSAEELAQDLAALKTQQSLLRKALKQRAGT